MAGVETYKKLYLFYHDPYQSNADYLEAFKLHPKVSEAHNVAVVYHPGLVAVSLQEKHNITSNTTNDEQNIEAKIKARERRLVCMFISR